MEIEVMSNEKIEAKLFSNNLYEGKVEIKVIDRDGDTVSSKTVHNEGCQKLFKFFAEAVAGNWSTLKDQVPCRIGLFEEAKEGEEKPWDVKYQCSPLVLFDSAPVSEEAKDSSGEVYGYKTTLHFRIPFLYVSNDSKIRRLALYSIQTTDLDTDRLADTTLAEDESIEVPTSAKNYTLIVNWSLIIKSAN